MSITIELNENGDLCSRELKKHNLTLHERSYAITSPDCDEIFVLFKMPFCDKFHGREVTDSPTQFYWGNPCDPLNYTSITTDADGHNTYFETAEDAIRAALRSRSTKHQVHHLTPRQLSKMIAERYGFNVTD